MPEEAMLPLASSAKAGSANPVTSSFTTYAEYLRSLGPSWASLWHWALIRYLEDEDHLSSTQQALSGSILRICSGRCSVSECSTFASPSELRNFLSTTEEDCQYQIIIMYYSCLAHGEPPSLKSLPVHPSIIDAVGLELGVSPLCWYSLLLESSYLPNFVHTPNAWCERNRMLQIGRDFLILPKTRATSGTKTGLSNPGLSRSYKTYNQESDPVFSIPPCGRHYKSSSCSAFSSDRHRSRPIIPVARSLY